MLVGEGVGVGEQRGEGRVVKPGVLFQLDFASPSGGENLGCLLGARSAGMNENVRKNAAGGQRRGDPLCVVAAAPGQPALVIAASNIGLGLGVTDEEQSAHG